MARTGKNVKRETPIEEETTVAVKMVRAVEAIISIRKIRDCSMMMESDHTAMEFSGRKTPRVFKTTSPPNSLSRSSRTYMYVMNVDIRVLSIDVVAGGSANFKGAVTFDHNL